MKTGFKILACGLRHCLQEERAAEQAGYSQAELRSSSCNSASTSLDGGPAERLEVP